MQRRLAAILAADVVDYSKLMGADQEGTLTALRQLRGELFEPVVVEHRGTVIKRLGDGWLVEFPSISDAAACAVQIQEGLDGHDVIRLRCGIHIGEVVFEEEDVFGDGVNIAARLEEIAEPGQVLISDTAQQSLDGKAAGRFAGGETRQLKNIARPVAVWHWPPGGRISAPTTDQTSRVKDRKRPTIAILPFDNMSQDPEQEYFSDGITEDIITELSRSNNLNVLARNATFGFKGQEVNPVDLGRELKADFMLEGSVRRSGERLRITAQLIDTGDGTHVWAERYDREMADIFAVQDEITEKIVGAIGSEFSHLDFEKSIRKAPGNVDAYDLFLKSIHHYFKFSREDNLQALEYAKQAVELDPEFAGGYCALSICYRQLTEMHWTNDYAGAFAETLKHAQKAVEIDPNYFQSYQCLAIVEARLGRIDRALAAIHKVLAMNPNRSLAHAQHAQVLNNADRFEEALEAMAKAEALDPNYAPPWYGTVEVVSLFGLERYEEAEAVCVKTITSIPKLPMIHAVYAAVLAHAGKSDKAKAAITEVLTLAPELSVGRIIKSMPAVLEPDDHPFIVGLRLAGLPEN